MIELDTSSIYEAVSLLLGAFIRVIRIRPSEVPNQTDPLACDFHLLNLKDGSLCDFKTGRNSKEKLRGVFGTHVRRSKRVQYTALSYTWGDATVLHTIYVNDKALYVRQNLWNFL
jgi:hypothetical protein